MNQEEQVRELPSLHEQAEHLMRLAESATGPRGYGVSPAFLETFAAAIEQAETAARIDELEQLWRTDIVSFNNDEMVPLAEVEKLWGKVNKRLSELKGVSNESK